MLVFLLLVSNSHSQDNSVIMAYYSTKLLVEILLVNMALTFKMFLHLLVILKEL